jgi:hypothetical protein
LFLHQLRLETLTDMQRLILHAGIHKTGSSAIQSALARNVDALRAKNIIYPDFRSLPAAKLGKVSSGNGVPLAKLLGSAVYPKQPVSRENIVAEIEQASAKGCDLLYSSETLLFIEPKHASAFFEFVRNAGFEVYIAFYLRSVADLAVSLYHQEVKQKRLTKSFSEFLQAFDAIPLRSALALCCAFGRERMHIRNYDVHKANLIEDFFSNMLGISPLDGLSLENPAVNRSLTPAELAIMREMNSVLSDPRHSRLASETLMAANPMAKYDRQISPDDYRIIEEKFSRLVEEINKYGLSNPISLKSDEFKIAETPSFQLSESEASLARLAAGLIEMVGAMRWPKPIG